METAGSKPLFSFKSAGLGPACYFGCPDEQFRAVEANVRIAEQDVALAQEAGLSVDGCRALAERAVSVRRSAENLIPSAGSGKNNGPWRLSPEDAQLAGKELMCCRNCALQLLGKRVSHVIVRPTDE